MHGFKGKQRASIIHQFRLPWLSVHHTCRTEREGDATGLARALIEGQNKARVVLECARAGIQAGLRKAKKKLMSLHLTINNTLIL